MTSPQTNPEHPQERAREQSATPPGTAGTGTETGTAGTEAAQAAPMTAPTQEAPEQRRDEAAPDQEGHAGGKVVHLHTAHPRIPIPYVTPGDLFTGARHGAREATSRLPGPRKLAYYGLLGGMAVAGALEWPVALAVGAATEVITREQRARARAEQEGQQGQQATAAPSDRTTESSRPAQTATA